LRHGKPQRPLILRAFFAHRHHGSLVSAFGRN
jgi:hypothetical protein